jgi:xanthine dehydrogenase YagR molybdenum-binding subunit
MASAESRRHESCLLKNRWIRERVGRKAFGQVSVLARKFTKGALCKTNLRRDYMVAVNADVPPIDVHFLDFPDKEINELGARGIGEIGLTGIAAAITAAVYHATGVRVRELPVKIEHLLA